MYSSKGAEGGARRKMGGKLGRDAWAFTGNVATSVFIVFVNKQLLVKSGFAYATTLCAFHFLACALSTWTFQALGLTTAARLPRADVLRFAVVANLSIASLNLSLLVNSVGFYQIAKLLIIPCVCAMEAVLYSKQVTLPVAASIATVLVGVGIVTVTDMHLNLLGLVIAAVSVITSGLQQIMCSMLQRKYALSSHQLLSNTAQVQGLMLLVVGPIIDLWVSSKWIGDYTWTLPAAQQLLVSCTLAVLVNISQFMCLGRFSAVTFQVLGHTKTILVLIISCWVFGERMTPRKLSGMALAVAGMIMYGWTAMQQQSAAPAAAAAAASNVGSQTRQEDHPNAVAAASSTFFGMLSRKQRLGLMGETLVASEDGSTNVAAVPCSRQQALASAAAAFFGLLRPRKSLGLYGENLVSEGGETCGTRSTVKLRSTVAGDAPATFFALFSRKRRLGLYGETLASQDEEGSTGWPPRRRQQLPQQRSSWSQGTFSALLSRHRARLGLLGEALSSRGESYSSEAASSACSTLELTSSSDGEDILKPAAVKLSQSASRLQSGKQKGRRGRQQQGPQQGVVAAVSVQAVTSKKMS